MRYISTRGEAPALGFEDVLLTGLATGPHLHYEFRVDGVHRDSLRVKLPKAKSISSSEKDSFMRKSKAMVNWLSSFTDNTTASLDSSL